MTSKLEAIRERLAVYDDNRVTLEHLSRLSNSGKIPTAEPGTLSKVIAFQAELADDLRALLAVVDASKRFKDVFGESRIEDWSDDFDAAMDAWMAAVDELTKGGA